MTNNQDHINELLEKLNVLLKKQEHFSREINSLQIEIYNLKNAQFEQKKEEETLQNKPVTHTNFEVKPEQHIVKPITQKAEIQKQIHQEQTHENPLVHHPSPTKNPKKAKSDLERFIGENLINKIGIAITIIGVAIGTKYSIEHELISPLTRIILGYLAGLGLLGFGLKLKKKYENYSAVLVSGAMTIMYFVTYLAYTLYELFPQVMAFTLMVIFTIFTVIAAINYNKQVIAHIGLVGAYAVPFLLSENSGKVAVLFTYMTIINIGVLVISFKKYWKSICYSSFALTWFIYFSWYTFNYQTEKHFGIALLFLTIFFVTFYLMILAYKLIKNEKFELDDIILLLVNTFLFYGIGYAIINANPASEKLLGLFTLCNAIIHFIVSVLLYRRKLADRNLFFMISGLVLVFITIAIPVQLNGNWVTLLWAGEAALLFWMGRAKNIVMYEKLSYPIIILTFLSLLHDWTTVYSSYIPEQPETRITPILNINFLSSLICIAIFSFITIFSQKKKYLNPLVAEKGISKVMAYAIPAILLFTMYYAFRLEISNYWNQLYIDSTITSTTGNNYYAENYWNSDFSNFSIIWILNYSLLFAVLLAFLNIKRLKNRLLGFFNLGFMVLNLIVFLIQGLYVLSELRESYLAPTISQHYHHSLFNIEIRYISFVFVALTLIAAYKYLQQEFIKYNFKVVFDLIVHMSILWISSSELIHWMDIANSAQLYKLGLSILWGIYALLLIILGIWKKKKHLRIGAIVLFGITLIKLFFYDISNLNTISKTIVFVSLGVLLLIISFLYNKYKHIISNEVVD
ncbi:DUF2339 domain-containing protein [Zhouia sp. PK063]|uniref:DUF2339 domain-containing protein n=1 Tax=Zhouia sp. PK063 TaxID=3373602 RepID=UPI0037956251